MTTISEPNSIASADRLYTRIAWRMIPLLVLIFFFANLDRANVGFAALQMRQELGFTSAAYGFGAGIFFLGYFLFEIPSNVALQKFGAKIWFTRIVLTWGIATVGLAFINDTTWFYILRFIIGAAEAGAAPGVMLYFSQWIPDHQRGRFNALFYVSVPIAFVASGPLSGFILTEFNGLAGYSGWRWLFAIEGILTILIAPLIIFGLSDKIADARWLSEDEKRAATDGIANLSKTADAHTYKDVFKKSETVFACLAYFCLLVGYYGIAFWLPQLIKLAGISNTMTIGWLASLPWLAAAIAVVIIGPLSDVPGRRNVVRNVFIAATAIGFWMSAYFSTNITLSLLGMTLAAVGILIVSTVFWANLARIYVAGAAAVGFATVNSLGNLGGFVSPYVLGLITDATGSPVTGIYAISASIVVSGLLMLACFRKSPG